MVPTCLPLLRADLTCLRFEDSKNDLQFRAIRITRGNRIGSRRLCTRDRLLETRVESDQQAHFSVE